MRKKLKTAIILTLLSALCLIMSGCKAGETLETAFAKKVEFAAGKFPVNAKTLELTVSAEELALLDEFVELEALKLSGSTCYAEIGLWAESHPHVELDCELPLPNGKRVQLMAREADLSGLEREDVEEAAELLSAMPRLESVDMGKGELATAPEFEDLLYLEEALPNVSFNWDKYSFELFGHRVYLRNSRLDLSEISSEELPLAAELIRHMPKLEHIELGHEREELPLAEVYSLQLDFPEIVQSYEFDLYGKTFDIKDEKMDLSYITLEDKGQALRELLPYLPRCTYVNMDSCGISNEEMAELQAEFPDKKLVWRLFFAKYTLLTDDETLLASMPSRGGSFTSKDLEVLKYTTDLKHIDLGHNGVFTDLSFIAPLTKLEVAIFACTNLRDISGIENCVNLEYLELYHSNVDTVEPLRGLTKLRHLNIGDTKVTDISPLYDLELERLWFSWFNIVPDEQIEKMRELHPDCLIDDTARDPDQGGWRYISYWPEEKHPRYALLREQFGYTRADFDFMWNDQEFWAHYTGKK